MEQYAQAPASTESNLFELQIDHEAIGFLSEIAKWTKFLSIVGFVFSGLMVMAAFFMGNLLSSLSPFGNSMGALGFLATIIYLGIASLIFFPNWYLFNFSRKMQLALRTNDQGTMNSSFGSLKSSYKFMGVLTIVILSIYLILLIIGLLR